MAKHAVGTFSIRGDAALLMQGQPEHTAAERIGEERQGQGIAGRKGEAVFGKDEMGCARLHRRYF